MTPTVPILAAASLSLLLLVACTDTDASTEPAQTTEADTGDTDAASTGGADTSAETAAPEDDGSGGTSSGGDEGPQALPLDQEWLDGLVGYWSGPIDPTPAGAVPFFPLTFAWQDDGSLHAHTDNPAGGFFDFRFFEQDGTWVFREEAELPSGMNQSYVLHPVERDGGRVRFTTLEAPEFLVVDIDVAPTHMTMQVLLMGMEHATFELDR